MSKGKLDLYSVSTFSCNGKTLANFKLKGLIIPISKK